MLKEIEKLKEMTETLVDKDNVIREYAAEWKYALNAIPDAVFITNENFDIKFANKAFNDIFNTSREELLTTKCHKLLYNLDDYKRCVCKGEDGEPRCYAASLSSRSNKWYTLKRAPILNDDEEVLGHVNILRDMTEEKETREELKRNQNEDFSIRR